MNIEDLKVGDIVIRGSASDNPIVNYGLVGEIKIGEKNQINMVELFFMETKSRFII